MLPTGLILGGIAAIVYAISQHHYRGAPWTFGRMERSTTAQNLGLSNEIPESLRTRAMGLGVVCGMLQAEGFRITSVYRSPEVTARVHADNDAQGVNQGIHVNAGPGDHDQARGIDVAPTPPSTNAGVLADLRARILATAVGPICVQALAEQNHVHLRFDVGALEELGRQRERNEQGNA